MESESAKQSDHDLILTMLAENQQLLKENNLLLKRQEKRARTGLIMRVIWIAVMLGLPFIIYFYVYNTVLGSFSSGNSDNPGSAINTDTLRELLDIYQNAGQ